MVLVGRDASPFTRQVAIWCRHTEREFDRLDLSTSEDAEALRAFHPAGRVPVLVLEDGTRLIETSAICDWLDETTPTERLIPQSGRARRDCLQRMACMTMANEKLVALFRARKSAMHDTALIERLEGQIQTGFDMLAERAGTSPFLGGARPDGSDVTLVCAWQMAELLEFPPLAARHPSLAAIVARAMHLPAFSESNPNSSKRIH